MILKYNGYYNFLLVRGHYRNSTCLCSHHQLIALVIQRSVTYTDIANVATYTRVHTHFG